MDRDVSAIIGFLLVLALATCFCVLQYHQTTQTYIEEGYIQTQRMGSNDTLWVLPQPNLQADIIMLDKRDQDIIKAVKQLQKQIVNLNKTKRDK